MKLLSLLMLSGVLCALFFHELKMEHRVLSSFKIKDEIFRLDDEFSRSFASVNLSVYRKPVHANISNQLWKIVKYTSFIGEKKISENMNLVTLVNTLYDGNITLGYKHKITLKALKFEEGRTLVLASKHLNEEVQLIPYQPKRISQIVKTSASAVKSQKEAKNPKRKNGIEISELELFLVSARIPKVSKKPLFSNSIQGSVRLIDGFIDTAEMVFGQLPGNINFDSLELNYVDIQNGGQISFEYMDEQVSGIFTKAGDGKYIMRVATGKLAGAAFTFATRDSKIYKKTMNKVSEADRKQDEAVKKRALASQKAFEDISYDFLN